LHYLFKSPAVQGQLCVTLWASSTTTPLGTEIYGCNQNRNEAQLAVCVTLKKTTSTGMTAL